MGDNNAQTILLADNRDSFRSSVKEFLELHGYSVMEASDLASAKAIMTTELVTLLVLDVRLTNEEDEDDESGVSLARQADPSIPKIILTNYPTPKIVREVMRPSANGDQPNTAVVDKKEGLDKLLSTIRLALAQFNPQYEAVLLQSFGSSKMIPVDRIMSEIGSDESLSRLRKSLAETAKALEKQRDDENRRVSQLHTLGLWTSMVVIGLIAGTLIPVSLGATKMSFLSMAASAIFKVVDVFCSKREDKAHERLRKLCERLEKMEGDIRLVEMASLFKNPIDRDEALKKIIDHILQLRLQR